MYYNHFTEKKKLNRYAGHTRIGMKFGQVAVWKGKDVGLGT